MKLLAMRIRECQARSTPGTVVRDGDTASPDRQRQRSGAADRTGDAADSQASELMRNAGLVPPRMPAMPAMSGGASEAQQSGGPGPVWQPPVPPYGMPHGGAGGGNGVGMWGGGAGTATDGGSILQPDVRDESAAVWGYEAGGRPH